MTQPSGLSIRNLAAEPAPMIRRPDLVESFESDLIRRERPDHGRNLRLVEALLDEARRLGAWPPADPLEGIEADLRLARILNVRALAGEDRPRAR